jgi:putative membrane protein
LANERTFLSWIRTSLALDAAGLAAIQLLPELAVPYARETLGVGLVVVGTVLSTLSFRRWLAVEQAMRRKQPIPPSWLPSLVAATVGVMSLAAAVLLVVGQAGR